MDKKPISPKAHGWIDYGFAAVLMTVPSLLNLSPKTVRLYAIQGSNLLLYNAVTSHPVAVKPLISFRTHGTVDRLNVSGLALMSLYRGIRKDKRALAFHLGFFTLAAINVLLTDWDAQDGR